ncbi:MAG TPA: hypothetical protein VMU50_23410 [Polyangia bacterium]|nr:hypothetical protein [Polyangia bacterium]
MRERLTFNLMLPFAKAQPEKTMLWRVDFQLSPGRQAIGIAVHDYHHGFMVQRLVYSTGVKICLEAAA